MATFGVLGSLTVVVGGRPVVIRSKRQRAVLALLLANARRLTSTDNLLRALWADDPPDTAVGQIQTVVWRLRGSLGEQAILTHPGGYELTAEPGELDTDEFIAAAARAEVMVHSGRLPDASECYTKALALWRGRPFADVQLPGDPCGSGLQAVIAELAEQRIAIERGLFDAELALGRHANVVPLLQQRIEEEPLREELRERLMLALYRSGRRAEALEAYRLGRAALVAELGLEPAQAMQRLNTLILEGDSTLDSLQGPGFMVDAPPAPALLPMDMAGFVAREELANSLAKTLSTKGATTPAMVAVTGAAGSGKTTLAVHAAHLVRQHFPQGQLFADLRGVDDPRDPAEVLSHFLRALGEDGRSLPSTVDELAALFRSRTSGRRILVVLDNAASEEQVRPLLPAAPECAVLVTSRRRLAALSMAQEIDLGVFEPEEALDLLRMTLGEERVNSQREDCLAVCERCGYLPLAIRIAAARLAARPHWPVVRLAEQLADERHRLDVLSSGDLAVRSSLALGVNALDPAQRRLFALLGQLEAPHVPAWAAAPLLDLPIAGADEPVERLVEARLVEVERSPAGSVQYRLHDLVRAFAREQIVEGAQIGLTRLTQAWLTLADAAYDRMAGGYRRVATLTAARWPGWSDSEIEKLQPDPVAWCEAERMSLVAAVRHAAINGETGIAWNLAVTLVRFFELREHLEDWRVTHEVALEACVAATDRAGEGYLLRGLGELHLNQDRFGDALARLTPALSIMERLGDRPGQAAVLRAAGTAHRMLGQETEAMTALERARAIFAETGDSLGQAQVLHNIGAVHRLAGRLAEAQGIYSQALVLFEEMGDRFGQAFTLCSLGIVTGYQPDRIAEADRYLRQSLELCLEFGYRRGEAIALGNLGQLYQRLGRLEEAAQELIGAVSICREIGDSHGEVMELRRLGEIYLDLDRTAAARSVLQRSLALARELGLANEEQSTMRLLVRAN